MVLESENRGESGECVCLCVCMCVCVCLCVCVCVCVAEIRRSSRPLAPFSSWSQHNGMPVGAAESSKMFLK